MSPLRVQQRSSSEHGADASGERQIPAVNLPKAAQWLCWAVAAAQALSRELLRSA